MAPWPLRLWHECKMWGTLPYDGGFLDQDQELMDLIGAAVYATTLATKPLKQFNKADKEYRDWILGD